MASPLSVAARRLTREAYSREIIPERVLWWLAAAGMRDWYRVLAKRLAEPLREAQAERGSNAQASPDDARALIAKIGARMFERRWEPLARRTTLPHGDARALALVMSALYDVDARSKSAWIFSAIGGPAQTLGERVHARSLLAKVPVRVRWEEVATHLGELLIVLTDDLPAHLPHARKLLGDICFDSGAKYAERVKKTLRIDAGDDAPAAAMEVLRMSEYVFRVNPEHWSGSDGTSGYLEGTACPWYERPGWNGAHCGIFGQFQSGIASAFGLRYHLSKTIPKHGGHTCRIDVKPIALGKKPAAAASQ
jgi:hypothetical protein